MLCVYIASPSQEVSILKFFLHQESGCVVLQVLNIGRYSLDIQSSQGMQKTELVQNIDSSILFLKTK